MTDPVPRGTLGTVHNAALLLELLSAGPRRQQITDLAERSGMSLATLHRLLRSLAAAGLVEQDQRSAQYGLGPELLRLAEQYRARQPVLTAASPFLVELHSRTRATVSLSVLVGDEVVEIDRIDGDDVGGIFRDASRVTAAEGSAAGRVLLGKAGAGHVSMEATDAADQAQVAAGLWGDDGEPIAAVTVKAPPDAMTLEDVERQILPHLLRTCSAISRALGHG